MGKLKQIKPEIESFAKIKVVGIGGAGGSAVDRMIEAGIKDLDFIVINTDAQALYHSKANTKIHIGQETTRGLGSGSDPKVGQDAAEESIDAIKDAIKDADMLFIAIGAGGGTGSGAAHIVARASKEMDILTVAFVTKPFSFEGEKRLNNAEFAIENLLKHVDTIVIIPNDKLLEVTDEKTPVTESFKIADDVLRQGIKGISDLITVHGLVNLDFADVKSIMKNSGPALMGIGRASGEDRAVVAAQQAIESRLLGVSINGARGILFNVIGGHDLAMQEIDTAAKVITESADQKVNVIFGATIDPGMEGEIIITVVATGFDDDYFVTRPPFTNDGEARPSPALKASESKRPIRRNQEDNEEPKKVSRPDVDITRSSEKSSLLSEPTDFEADKDDDKKEDNILTGDSDDDSMWSDDDGDDQSETDRPSIFRRLKGNRGKK